MRNQVSNTKEQENFGRRFTLLLNYSEFKGNTTAFNKVFNEGKTSSSGYKYKKGGNIRLENLIKSARSMKIHYSEFVDFSSNKPLFDFIDPLKFEERVQFEKNKITERLNMWIKECNLTNLEIELLMPEFKNIDQSNISKIRLGTNQHELLTYEKFVNVLNKTVYDLFKD